MACFRLIDVFKCVVLLATCLLLKTSFYNEVEISANSFHEPPKPFDLNVQSYLVPPLFLNQPKLPNKVDILIMVTTAPNNYQARIDIRDTWGHPDLLHKYNIGLAFIAGQSNEIPLKSEIQEFQDILQINIVDNYLNLTLKSIFMLKYLEELHFKDDRKVAVLKTDDDCYVNIPALSRLVKHNKHAINIIGFPLVHTNTKKLPVNRPKPNFDNKWAIPYWMYKGDYFPEAVSGSGYVFPLRKVSCLFQASFKVPLITLEDIYVTGKTFRQIEGLLSILH